MAIDPICGRFSPGLARNAAGFLCGARCAAHSDFEPKDTMRIITGPTSFAGKPGLGDHRIVTTLCPGGKERMRRLLSLVQSGRFDPTPLIPHRFSLDEITRATSFRRTIGRRDESRHQAVTLPTLNDSVHEKRVRRDRHPMRKQT